MVAYPRAHGNANTMRETTLAKPMTPEPRASWYEPSSVLSTVLPIAASRQAR